MIHTAVWVTDYIMLQPVDADEGLVGINIDEMTGYMALTRDEVDRLIEALEEARA